MKIIWKITKFICLELFNIACRSEAKIPISGPKRSGDPDPRGRSIGAQLDGH